MKGTIADRAAHTVVEIQHRREAQIDTMREQLRGEDVAGRTCRIERCEMIVIPHLPQRAHCRQAGEAIGAKPLHTSTFMIDRNHKRGVPQTMDFGRECSELFRSGEVACEQDDPADQRIAQALALVVVEFRAGNVEHDGAAWQLEGNSIHGFSMTANATT